MCISNVMTNALVPYFQFKTHSVYEQKLFNVIGLLASIEDNPGSFLLLCKQPAALLVQEVNYKRPIRGCLNLPAMTSQSDMLLESCCCMYLGSNSMSSS